MFSPVELPDWGSNQPFMHILWYVHSGQVQIGSSHNHIHAAKFYKRVEFSEICQPLLLHESSRMDSKVDLAALSAEGLFKHLTLKEGLDKSVATTLKKEKVTGQDFLELTTEDLASVIPNLSLGPKKAIQRIQATYSSNSPEVTKRKDAKAPSPSKRLAVATKESCKRMPSQGPLDIYKLDMKIKRNDRHNRIVMCEFGQLPCKATSSSRKVLMVVGATGAGKSTLINGMVNYLLGVSWDDDFRFKLISDGALTQAQSQTKDITAYTFHEHKDSPLPYTLTVIDTPGFGDTEGLDKDKRIVKQVKELFSLRGPDGIDEIHGIGFVAQASEARLTHTQKYIFDSILSIFGKDMSGNMFMMITFADGQRPPVLDALKVAGIPGFDESFYKFNNSALYASNQGVANGDDSDDDHVDKMFWKMGMKSFKTFFLQLGEKQGGSLQHTKEVLREREHLEALVSGLQPKIRQGLSKMDEMRQEEAAIKKFEAEIEANKSFTYRQTQSREKRVPLKAGEHVTVCMHCHYTCHYPCYIPKNSDKMNCAAMTGGKCDVCISKCDWNMHENTGYRLELYDVEVEVTSEQLKAKYYKAQSGKSTQQEMLDRMKAELQQMQSLVVDTIFQAKRSLARLNEIAMKSNPLSEVQYIELLIESEKSQGKPGFMRRIQSLEACKEEAKLLAKIGQGGMHQHVDDKSWWRLWK